MQTLRGQAAWCTRVQYVLGASIVVILIGFYLFGFRPKDHALKELRELRDDKRKQLSDNESRTNNLPIIELDVEKSRIALERFDKKLPKQQELSQFIKDITQLSHRSNLRKLTVQPGVPRKYELFAALPILLNFEGDFMNVFSFLRQTEEMQRLTRVQSVNVRCTDAKLGTVEVQVSMNIYFTEG